MVFVDCSGLEVYGEYRLRLASYFKNELLIANEWCWAIMVLTVCRLCARCHAVGFLKGDAFNSYRENWCKAKPSYRLDRSICNCWSWMCSNSRCYSPFLSFPLNRSIVNRDMSQVLSFNKTLFVKFDLFTGFIKIAAKMCVIYSPLIGCLRWIPPVSRERSFGYGFFFYSEVIFLFFF